MSGQRPSEATPPAEGPIRCECKVIHDRVTSKHVQTGLDENGEDGTPKTCALLNELATRRERATPANEATVTELLDVLEEILSTDKDMLSSDDTIMRAEALLLKHGRGG